MSRIDAARFLSTMIFGLAFGNHRDFYWGRDKKKRIGCPEVGQPQFASLIFGFACLMFWKKKRKQHFLQMVAWWWFTMVQSVKNHLKQIQIFGKLYNCIKTLCYLSNIKSFKHVCRKRGEDPVAKLRQPMDRGLLNPKNPNPFLE